MSEKNGGQSSEQTRKAGDKPEPRVEDFVEPRPQSTMAMKPSLDQIVADLTLDSSDVFSTVILGHRPAVRR